jgi:hypothetical protein
LEHRDDTEHGVGGLFGLVKDQYVVVYLHSHEMFVLLEGMAGHYKTVVKQKPDSLKRLTDEQYRNIACIVHLENMGFGKFGSKAVRPVKVMLPVGKMFFFHLGCVHCGMGRANGDIMSIRGHIYWANMQRLLPVSKHTISPWLQSITSGPSLFILGQNRDGYELGSFAHVQRRP